MNKLTPYMLLMATVLGLFVASNGQACSRFTYTPAISNQTITQLVVSARSMDWVEDIHTDLWAFPAGMKRVGSDQPNSVTWVAKYGSVIASGYNLAAADGINTEGLTANLLYLSTADYGAPHANRQNLSILNWAQYMLDHYATVNEAVSDYGQDRFNIIAPPLPNGAMPTVHLSITDATGDNAVFEYLQGRLVVHHGAIYRVMTNEPSYDKQLALNEYWQALQGKFLPGTGEPADRFVRASYYLNAAPHTATVPEAIATAFSIIRDVSVPIQGIFSDRPNVAPTLWRSVTDVTHRLYYFESANRPNVFWVDMSLLSFKPDAPVKKLSLQHGEIYTGEVSAQFKPSKRLF